MAIGLSNVPTNYLQIMFFEARKGKDLYLHLAKVPNGATLKFHVQNRTSSGP